MAARIIRGALKHQVGRDLISFMAQQNLHGDSGRNGDCPGFAHTPFATATKPRHLPAVGQLLCGFRRGQVGDILVSGGRDKGIWDKGMSAVPRFPCPPHFLTKLMSSG